MEFEHILVPVTEEIPRSGEGSIVELKDGRLLLSYTEFYGGGADNSAAHIVGLHSADGGRTWTDRHILQPNTGAENVMSSSLLRLQNGEVAFFYLQKNSLSDCFPCVRFSSDEGGTWSEPIRVGSRNGYHVMNNDRPIQLASGRLLAPIAIVVDATDPTFYQTAFCYCSDDNGRTWREGAEQRMETTVQEPGLVELKDGRVLMIVRTPLQCICKAISSDGGETWSEFCPMPLASPMSPAAVKRIPSTGDLVIFYNNNGSTDEHLKHRRTPLTTAISRNEGETWTCIRDLEPDRTHVYCYLSACFTGDDVLMSYYYGGERNLEALKIKRVPIRRLCE